MEMYDGGAATFSKFSAASSTTPVSWVLIDGVTSGVGCYIRRHGDWLDGSFDLKVHWSTDANGGNVVFSATIEPTTEQVAFPTATACDFTVVVGTQLLPKLSTLMSASLRQESLIGRQHMGVYMRLNRVGGDAADTNTGDVSIYGIELVYNERKRVVGSTIKR